MKISIILAIALNVLLITHASKEDIGKIVFEGDNTYVADSEDIAVQFNQDPIGQMKIEEFVKEQGSDKRYEVKDGEARIVPLFATFNYQEPEWQKENILIELSEEEAINLYLFSNFYKNAVDMSPGQDDNGYCEKYEINPVVEHKKTKAKTLYYLEEQEGVCEVQITDKNECAEAVEITNAQQGNRARRKLQAGNWDWVPPSCSVQTGGDWAIHFNSRKNPLSEFHNQSYQPNMYTQVCKYKKNSIDENMHLNLTLRADACKAIRSVDFTRNTLVFTQVHATHMKMIMEFVNKKHGVSPPEEGYVKGLRFSYVKMANGQVCQSDFAITSEENCKLAAASLGLTYGNGWTGPNDFPGCLFADDGRRKVYFNRSPTAATRRPTYAGICNSDQGGTIELGSNMSSPGDYDINFVNKIWDQNMRDVNYVLFAANYLEINSLAQLMGARIGQEIMSVSLEDLALLADMNLKNEFLHY